MKFLKFLRFFESPGIGLGCTGDWAFYLIATPWLLNGKGGVSVTIGDSSAGIGVTLSSDADGLANKAHADVSNVYGAFGGFSNSSANQIVNLESLYSVSCGEILHFVFAAMSNVYALLAGILFSFKKQ